MDDKKMAEKLLLTQKLVNGLTANEWRIICQIIDRQYGRVGSNAFYRIM